MRIKLVIGILILIVLVGSYFFVIKRSSPESRPMQHIIINAPSIDYEKLELTPAGYENFIGKSFIGIYFKRNDNFLNIGLGNSSLFNDLELFYCNVGGCSYFSIETPGDMFLRDSEIIRKCSDYTIIFYINNKSLKNEIIQVAKDVRCSDIKKRNVRIELINFHRITEEILNNLKTNYSIKWVTSQGILAPDVCSGIGFMKDEGLIELRECGGKFEDIYLNQIEQGESFYFEEGKVATITYGDYGQNTKIGSSSDNKFSGIYSNCQDNNFITIFAINFDYSREMAESIFSKIKCT